MIEYGNIIQTVSILSIIICAPVGAILISTFGPLFLSHTSETITKQVPDTEELPAIEIEMEEMREN